MSTARAHWRCPECGITVTSWADDEDTAAGGAQQVIREHLDKLHPDSAGLTNAAAQAADAWLAPASHLVALWGGPEDGAELWLPPGPLPATIGVHRGEKDGRLYPLQSATGRLLAQRAGRTYQLDPLLSDNGGRTYVWTP